MQHAQSTAHADYADPAAFFLDGRGQAAIAFSDPAFIRSDLIVVDPSDRSVHAVLHEASHLIGHVSAEMLEAILGGGEVLLAALHSRGHIVDLLAPVSAATGHERSRT